MPDAPVAYLDPLAAQSDELRVSEIAAQERVHPATVRRWIASGDLPAHRVGPRLIRVRRVDLEAFRARGRMSA